jgi:hypothetical protein
MEATCSFETSVNLQETTWRYTAEDRTLHLFWQLCVIFLTSVNPDSSITSSLRLFSLNFYPASTLRNLISPFTSLINPPFVSVQHSDPHRSTVMSIIIYIINRDWLPNDFAANMHGKVADVSNYASEIDNNTL